MKYVVQLYKALQVTKSILADLNHVLRIPKFMLSTLWSLQGQFHDGMRHGVGTKTEWYGQHGRRLRVWYKFNLCIKKRDMGPCTREDPDPETSALREKEKSEKSTSMLRNSASGKVRSFSIWHLDMVRLCAYRRCVDLCISLYIREYPDEKAIALRGKMKNRFTCISRNAWKNYRYLADSIVF